ncbi:MAG: alginate export family protein [Nitrococcus sp.]|nr:alginate export family protein [Nitrococcus sp.]
MSHTIYLTPATPWRRLTATLVLALSLTAPAAAEAKPWRLHDALAAPAWLKIGGSYRVRYETLNHPFRAGAVGSNQILVERLVFAVRADLDAFYTGFELRDSRAQLENAGTPLGTDDVNTAEPVRAYIGIERSDVFATGDRIDLAGGRMILNFGAGRLVAIHNFRNTVNGFTGIRALWEGAGGKRVQTFYTLVVDRRPNTRSRLEHNDIQIDRENPEARFWGVYLTDQNIFGWLRGEAYVFGLHENDHSDFPTANRHLLTPGLRFFAKPAQGAWDFEIEAAVQVGKSRSTASPANTADLDHRAGFIHAQVARTLDSPWSPRFVLEYDYASGDEDPNDGENNRFDSLFGAIRSDFGPTGIYGALTRANISSPGARIQVKPRPILDAFVGYRAVWLASDRDALPSAGVQDPTGRSGSFVGHQVEARVRADILPGNLRLELGGAYLFDGEFLKDAPNAPHNGNTAYLYSQAILSF